MFNGTLGDAGTVSVKAPGLSDKNNSAPSVSVAVFKYSSNPEDFTNPYPPAGIEVVVNPITSEFAAELALAKATLGNPFADDEPEMNTH